MEVMFVEPNPEISDDDLMAQACGGHEDSFVCLYKRYKDFVFRFIFFRCFGDYALAEDLAQNVWIKLVKQPTYQSQGKFKSWLCTLSRNEVIDYFRQNRIPTRALQEEFDLWNQDSKLEQTIEVEGLNRKLFHCLKKLPFEQKDAFLLYLADMTITEIAKITQVNLETAKTRVRYAKKKLKKSLANEINGS